MPEYHDKKVSVVCIEMISQFCIFTARKNVCNGRSVTNNGLKVEALFLLLPSPAFGPDGLPILYLYLPMYLITDVLVQHCKQNAKQSKVVSSNTAQI